MINLYEPLEDSRANQLRNQVLAIENLIIQLSTDNQDDVPLLSLMNIERMKRMDELARLMAV